MRLARHRRLALFVEIFTRTMTTLAIERHHCGRCLCFSSVTKLIVGPSVKLKQAATLQIATLVSLPSSRQFSAKRISVWLRPRSLRHPMKQLRASPHLAPRRAAPDANSLMSHFWDWQQLRRARTVITSQFVRPIMRSSKLKSGGGSHLQLVELTEIRR